MEARMEVLLLSFSFALCIFSSSASIDLSPSSGTISEDLCLGEVIAFTCTTNTGSVGWRWRPAVGSLDTASYTSPTAAPQVVAGTFNTGLIRVSGNNYISVATVNVTSALNGGSLECGDTTFSNVGSVTVNVQDISNISATCSRNISSNQTLLSWAGVCISHCRVEASTGISETVKRIYYILSHAGNYDVNVTCFNYIGEMVNTINFEESISSTSNPIISTISEQSMSSTFEFMIEPTSSTDFMSETMTPTPPPPPPPPCNFSCCRQWFGGAVALAILIIIVFVGSVLFRVYRSEWFQHLKEQFCAKCRGVTKGQRRASEKPIVKAEQSPASKDVAVTGM